MKDLKELGIYYSTDGQGIPQIQRIDDVTDPQYDGFETVQLHTDAEARQVLVDAIADKYIESIHQDLGEGDNSLLYALLTGEGLKPLNTLTDEGIMKEAIELEIIKNQSPSIISKKPTI